MDNDLISRQAAIDEMAELQGRASSKGELTGISKAWKRIKQLSSAEPRWVPVTERLPEYGDKVLVTFHNKYIDRTTIGVSCCYVQKEGFFSDTPFDYAPIAWMPLPTPWKGESDA